MRGSTRDGTARRSPQPRVSVRARSTWKKRCARGNLAKIAAGHRGAWLCRCGPAACGTAACYGRAHGEGRRRPHGAPRVGDPHTACQWSARRRMDAQRRSGNRIWVDTSRSADRVGRAGSFNPEEQRFFRFRPFGPLQRKEWLRSCHGVNGGRRPE